MHHDEPFIPWDGSTCARSNPHMISRTRKIVLFISHCRLLLADKNRIWCKQTRVNTFLGDFFSFVRSLLFMVFTANLFVLFYGCSETRARQLSQQHQRQSARIKNDSDEIFSRVDPNDWSYFRSRAPIEIALTSDGSVLAEYNGEGEREEKTGALNRENNSSFSVLSRGVAFCEREEGGGTRNERGRWLQYTWPDYR